MGSVKIDIHKRFMAMEQLYPLSTVRGVLSFLSNIHHIRELRYRGDIDASTMLVDFMSAYKQAPLTQIERQTLYYRCERDMAIEDVAVILDVSNGMVVKYVKSAARKIAKAYVGGAVD